MTLSRMKKNISDTAHWEIVDNFYAMKNYVWKDATCTGELIEEIGAYRGQGNPQKKETEQHELYRQD